VHHHNHWYGHVRILARYAGVPVASKSTPRMWGYLQHGWNVHDGFGARTPITPGMPRFVWSEGARRRGWAAGHDGYEIIGSPWAYLLHLEPEQPDPTPREGTIVYPFHAFDKQPVHGDHLALADEIRATEPGPVTVCLYYLEWRDPAVRARYERHGFRVITHGYRGDRVRPSNGKFLSRQLAELRRHRRVVSNRLSTALLYGASVGCQVGVYGDPMVIADDHPVYGGVERIRSLWPEMHQPDVPAAVASAFAYEELGLRHVISPAELADVCGWTATLPLGHR
jgi:hypothetical protein